MKLLLVAEVRSILFLDVGGVLLRRRHPGLFDGFELASRCLEFLERATARFRCFWLTSRARTGWPDAIRCAFRAAGAVLDDPRWAVLGQIEPAAWTMDRSKRQTRDCVKPPAFNLRAESP